MLELLVQHYPVLLLAVGFILVIRSGHRKKY